MSFSLPGGILADQARIVRMGDRFRGSTDAIDVEQLATFALIFTMLALVLWLATAGAKLLSRFRRTSPTMLFWELCQAHGIHWRMRWQLWLFALASRLDNPARLFVEPQLLNDKVLAAWPVAHRQKIFQLRNEMFS